MKKFTVTFTRDEMELLGIALAGLQESDQRAIDMIKALAKRNRVAADKAKFFCTQMSKRVVDAAKLHVRILRARTE